MAMVAGDQNAASGTMTRSIYEAMNSVLGAASLLESDQIRRQICAAIAQGVIAHITANAEVNTDTGEIT